MKKLTLLLLVVTFLPLQSAWADKCGPGWKIWAASSAIGIVAGSVMLGVSTYPNGNFNQQQYCDTGATAFCCDSGSGSSPTGCTAQTSLTPECASGKSVYCGGTSPTQAAPWKLQPWAKSVQIIGAVLLPVSAVSTFVSLIAGAIIIAFH